MPVISTLQGLFVGIVDFWRSSDFKRLKPSRGVDQLNLVLDIVSVHFVENGMHVFGFFLPWLREVCKQCFDLLIT
jgi:hypothetical protein